MRPPVTTAAAPVGDCGLGHRDQVKRAAAEIDVFASATVARPAVRSPVAAWASPMRANEDTQEASSEMLPPAASTVVRQIETADSLFRSKPAQRLWGRSCPDRLIRLAKSNMRCGYPGSLIHLASMVNEP